MKMFFYAMAAVFALPGLFFTPFWIVAVVFAFFGWLYGAITEVPPVPWCERPCTYKAKRERSGTIQRMIFGKDYDDEGV